MGVALPSSERPQIAGRIMLILKERGWSQRELGRRAGFAAPTQLGNVLRRLEEGSDVEVETLIAVADGAEVTLSWLVTGAGESRLAPSVTAASSSGREDLRRGNRVFALRLVLGMTQAAVVTGARQIPPGSMGSIEDGTYSLESPTGVIAKELIARGFGLAPRDFKAYLADKLSLRDAARWARQTRSNLAYSMLGLAPQGRLPLPVVVLRTAVPAWEDALARRFDGQQHAITDLDAARGLGRTSDELQALGIELSSFARLALDVAAATRGRTGNSVPANELAEQLIKLLSFSSEPAPAAPPEGGSGDLEHGKSAPGKKRSKRLSPRRT